MMNLEHQLITTLFSIASETSKSKISTIKDSLVQELSQVLKLNTPKDNKAQATLPNKKGLILLLINKISKIKILNATIIFIFFYIPTQDSFF